MEKPKMVAEDAQREGDSTATEQKRERRMTIARFAVPERFGSSAIEGIASRLGSVGVESYQVELAGAGEPLLDLEDVTYVGEQEIEDAVDSIVAERSSQVYS